VSVAIQKLEGVRDAKVSLNEGKAVVALEPANTVTLARIRELVRRNGFTPQGATVTLRARVVAAGDTLRLEIPETKETFQVATTPHAGQVAQLEKHAGQVVVVEGLIAAPKEKAPAVIQVTRVGSDGAKP
jgi:hypothetical protein